jgi:hypothetical protein
LCQFNGELGYPFSMKPLQEGRIRTVRFAMKPQQVRASRRSVIHMTVAIFENHSKPLLLKIWHGGEIGTVRLARKAQ